MYRIGYSEDIHPIVNDRPLYLGGVLITNEFGLLGHSDADVVLHALTESILGALALGDLGDHFPDNDPKYKGIASRLLLEEVKKMMEKEGYEINNIDIQVAASKPKLAPFKLKMREEIASILGIELSKVSIKAMSFNKVGPIGEGLAIKASAITMLKKK